MVFLCVLCVLCGGEFPGVSASSVLRERVVLVTVHPPLAWLRGRNHRMRRRFRVFGGMAVRRVVAAVRAAALLARPQVHPLAADLDALVADVFFRVLHRLDRIDVGAGPVAHRSSSFRFHFPSDAPTSYVDCRKSSSAARGDGAVRTSSYFRKNSPPAPASP